MSFNLQYASGTNSIQELMTAEKSRGRGGINMSLSQASFTPSSHRRPCSSCSWELQNWGAGWIFAPDYYPRRGAVPDRCGVELGSYSDKTNDSNILATNTTQARSRTTRTTGRAASGHLPAQRCLPVERDQARPVRVTPQSPLIAINPEDWRFGSVRSQGASGAPKHDNCTVQRPSGPVLDRARGSPQKATSVRAHDRLSRPTHRTSIGRHLG